jgi:hypothetical protein
MLGEHSNEDEASSLSGPTLPMHGEMTGEGREGQAGTGPPETGTADGTTGEEPTAEGVAGRETGGAEPGPERSEVTSPEKGPGESGARGREGGEGGLVFRRLRRSNR